MNNFKCSNPVCKINETGKCVEGLTPEECSFVLLNDEENDCQDDEVQDEEIQEVEVVPNDTFVHRGNLLSLDSATKILMSGESRVVAIVGPQEAGKTTLNLSFYESFQQNQFGGRKFAGSLSLVTYEKLCHFSRIASGQFTPDTPRTSVTDDLGFMHLAVQNDGITVDLLISDRAGEFYSNIANSEESCKNLYEIIRADCSIFLVDGDKFSSDEKNGIKQDLLMIIDTLIDEKILNNHSKIIVVLTKYDRLIGHQSEGNLLKDYEEFCEFIRKRYQSDIQEIGFSKVAARSKNSAIESGYGVEELFSEILKPRIIEKYNSDHEILHDRYFYK